LGCFGGVESALVASDFPPKEVVNRFGTVDAECPPLEASIGQFLDSLGRQRLHPTGCERHPETEFRTVLDEVGEVITDHWAFPREDDQLPLAEPPCFLE
jgi:hypothetical protein